MSRGLRPILGEIEADREMDVVSGKYRATLRPGNDCGQSGDWRAAAHATL